MEYIDYDDVAEIYDLYTATTYDFRFFSERIRPGSRVLELTSGTGRLSIPLIEAGADLTCVDISKKMLDVLEQKLKKNRLKAELLCADVQYLNFEEDFELAILPFQSFMELVGEEKQLNTLSSVHRSLVSGGRFFCTMHNPFIRRTTVDGILRAVGEFRLAQGTVVVSGFETGGRPVVQRSQFFEHYDESGILVKKRLQSMIFELIEENSFRRMAVETGFIVSAVYGDYEANPFEPEISPVMIWELEKP